MRFVSITIVYRNERFVESSYWLIKARQISKWSDTDFLLFKPNHTLVEVQLYRRYLVATIHRE